MSPSLGRLLLLLASAGLGELGLHPPCLEPRQGLLRAESPGRSPWEAAPLGAGRPRVAWLGQGLTPLYPSGVGSELRAPGQSALLSTLLWAA